MYDMESQNLPWRSTVGGCDGYHHTSTIGCRSGELPATPVSVTFQAVQHSERSVHHVSRPRGKIKGHRRPQLVTPYPVTSFQRSLNSNLLEIDLAHLTRNGGNKITLNSTDSLSHEIKPPLLELGRWLSNSGRGLSPLRRASYF
jgi:hypothetical protein